MKKTYVLVGGEILRDFEVENKLLNNSECGDFGFEEGKRFDDGPGTIGREKPMGQVVEGLVCVGVNLAGS